MLKRLYLRTDFYRNAVILILGTGVGQAIPVLLQPFLRRIYSPEEFGIFAVYFGLVNIITVIATLRYELAVGIPKSDDESANLLFLCFWLNLFIHIIILGVILLYREELAVLFKIPERFSGILYILPFSTFFFCLFQAINYWLIRKKAFWSISINKISRRGTEGTVQLGFGIFRNAAGLFVGDLAGNLANTISGIGQLKKTNFPGSSYSRESIWDVFKKYSHFPKFNLLPHLLGTIAMQFPVFIINNHYSKTDLGFYNLTQQAIVFPFSLITVAVSQVLLQLVTERRNKEQPMLRDFLGLSLSLLAIGLFSLVVIELWGPRIFSFVFGPNWILAGSYSRILISGYLFFLIAAPMNGVLIGLEKIRALGFWNVLHFIFMILLGLVKDLSFTTFLYLFAAIEVISFGIFYLLSARAVWLYEKTVKGK